MLSKLFNPKSVAVIGASENPEKVGNNILQNLIDNGFRGKLYPINLKDPFILGIKAYDSVLKVKSGIDLAIIAIPAFAVPNALEEAGKKGIPFAIIISAGFKEVGSEGMYLENKIKEISRKYNIRILGPNCLGLINLTDNFNASFSSIIPKKGNIAFISQSGALCTSILSLSVDANFGFSKFISIGNKADINEGDLIDYLAGDPSTDLILLYLESITDVAKFKQAVQKAIKKKPIIMLKAGVSEAGKSAISSHTGSMAGSDNLYSALFSQIGVIRVSCLSEFFDASELFSKFLNVKNSNLGIITNGGGVGVVTADSCEKEGIKLGKISNYGIKKLRKVLPSNAGFGNPLDVIGDARAERFLNALKVIDQEEDIGIILVILTPQSMTQIVETAEIVVDFSKKSKKPILTSFIGDEVKMKLAHGILNENNVPNFDLPEMAVKAVSMFNLFNNARIKKESSMTEVYFEKNKIERIIGIAKSENRRLLTMDEGFKLLKLSGINVAPYLSTLALDDLKRFLNENKEIILKIDTSYEAHKTEMGFVSEKIDSEDKLNYWFKILKERAEKHKQAFKFLAQKFEKGNELILGAIKHNHFGHVLSVGFGGIYTEILKDVAFGISPLTKDEMLDMIKSLKLYPVLKGFRNQPALDIDFLINTLNALQTLITSFKEIKEIEINPLLLKRKNETSSPVDILIKIDF